MTTLDAIQAFLYQFAWPRKLIQTYYVYKLKGPIKRHLMRDMVACMEQQRSLGTEAVDAPDSIDIANIGPDAPPEVRLYPFGLVTIDWHGVRVQREDGLVHFHGRDGQQVITAPAHTRIEIVDTNEVLSHQTNRMYHTTSHVIHFRDGGTFSYMVDDARGAIEMVPNNVSVNWETPGVLRISRQ